MHNANLRYKTQIKLIQMYMHPHKEAFERGSARAGSEAELLYAWLLISMRRCLVENTSKAKAPPPNLFAIIGVKINPANFKSRGS